MTRLVDAMQVLDMRMVEKACFVFADARDPSFLDDAMKRKMKMCGRLDAIDGS